MELLREDCIVETYDTSTIWGSSHNGVCVTHVPTGIIERCSDSRNVHANLEKALGEIEKKIEHINQGGNAMNDRAINGLLSSHQLAHCLAASAIHQIGGTLESMLSENTLLADLTNEMRKCAGDILETANSDPWMFYVLINTAVSSGVLKLIDMKDESDG